MSNRDIVGISRDRLRHLLEDEATLAALEAGGVDNWEFYGDSLEDHLSTDDSGDTITEIDDFDSAVTRDDVHLFMRERGLCTPSCEESVHQMDCYQEVSTEFMEFVMSRLGAYVSSEETEDE